MKMSINNNCQKQVLILGAGASAHAGFPLISEFRDSIFSENVIQKYKDDGCTPENRIYDYYYSVQNLWEKCPDKNIEQMIKLMSNPSRPEYKSAISSIITAQDSEELGKQYFCNPAKYCIVHSFDKISNKSDLTTPYMKLVERFEGTIITFNWDNMLDKCLKKYLNIDWPQIGMIDDSKIQYLKLHGSFDTFYCLNCNEIFMPNLELLFSDIYMSKIKCPLCGSEERREKNVNDNPIHELYHYNSEPLMIGFSSDKKNELFGKCALVNQWNFSRKAILACEQLTFIGFSMNETDDHLYLFFDSIFRCREKDLNITVIDPKANKQLIRNYLTFLGHEAKINQKSTNFRIQKYNCQISVNFEKSNFENYCNK
ncbi:MAG: hypothetical protein V3V99_07910 [candidate division Zixibacteria bacterium]